MKSIILNKQIEISGKKCYFYADPSPEAILIQPLGKEETETLAAQVTQIKSKSKKPFVYAGFVVEDWNTELSPWEAPPVFGKTGFGKDAEETLIWIKNELIPYVHSEFPESAGKKHIIGGYSLAGLFSLWSAYVSDLFYGTAGVSPSVWFPGWLDYIQTHKYGASYVYLSLGDTENKTKNTVMRTVKDNIESQYSLLREQLSSENCLLEWNHGGHFNEPEIRTAKGFVHLLNMMR